MLSSQRYITPLTASKTQVKTISCHRQHKPIAPQIQLPSAPVKAGAQPPTVLGPGHIRSEQDIATSPLTHRTASKAIDHTIDCPPLWLPSRKRLHNRRHSISCSMKQRRTQPQRYNSTANPNDTDEVACTDQISRAPSSRYDYCIIAYLEIDRSSQSYLRFSCAQVVE